MNPGPKWVVPPGYRGLADVLQEFGHDITRDCLVSGQWQAFKFDVCTGGIEPVRSSTWCAFTGRKWLEDARTDHLVISKPNGRIELTTFALVIQPAPQHLPRKRKKRKAPQGDRLEQALLNCYPGGTDGIPTKAVHRNVRTRGTSITGTG